MICFSKLGKAYNSVKAISDLSFMIEDREIFGLLGPNGAGKTTTILILSTALKPTYGDVTVGSFSVTREPHKIRELLGVSFQEPVLDPRLSVIQNLKFHAEACGISKRLRDERIKAELEYLDMWNDRDKKASKISGGMKRKVENIKLFIQKPNIAVFDEPTAYLDPPSKHKVWNRIRELQENDSTVLLATNQMDDADQLCDRVAIISKGKLVAIDTISRLKRTIPGGEVIQLKMTDPNSDVDGILRALPVVKGLSVAKKANIIQLYVDRSEQALPIILSTLLERKLDVAELDIKKPSLDDVFMHFTGEVL